MFTPLQRRSALTIIILCCSAFFGSAHADDSRLANGVFFVAANGLVFGSDGPWVAVSSGDLKTWKLFGPDLGASALGGSADHPIAFVDKYNSNGTQVVKLSATTQPTLLFDTKELINRGEFLSENLGCIAVRGTVVMTFDGGRTWSAPFHVFKNPEVVNCVRWISEHEIILGGAVNGLRDYPVAKRIGPAAKWSTTMPSSVGTVEPFGNGTLAVMSDKLRLISLTNGRQIGECQPEIETEGFAVYGSKIIFYGLNAVSIWSWGGGAFTHEKTFKIGYASVIVAQGLPTIIDQEGVFKLDGDRLVPWKIEIVKTPLVEQLEKPAPGEITPEEFADVFSWARKVDGETRNRIFGEANEKKQLSPRDRLLWARDQFKRITQGAATTTRSATTGTSR